MGSDNISIVLSSSLPALSEAEVSRTPTTSTIISEYANHRKQSIVNSYTSPPTDN